MDAYGDLTATVVEPPHPELTGYCYRMLGSAFEAEDAVQPLIKGGDSGRSRLRGTLNGPGRFWFWMYCLTIVSGA